MSPTERQPAPDDGLAADNYDEFGYLHENAAEIGIPFPGRPDVVRGFLEVGTGQELSYIRWGTAEPEIVFLHGGGQNAHTWDYVALALGRPALAVDLPGHGHSYRRPDRNYGPWRNVEALEVALPALAPKANVVVGMSLGGATLIHLAAKRPDLCRRAVIVDVTPHVSDTRQRLTRAEQGTVALVGGQPTYASFEEMADTAIALSPYRAASGVRRGVRHNAYRRPDGLWTWRYDLFGPPPAGGENWNDHLGRLWADVDAITVPTMLVRGGESKFVADADADEFRRRLPSARYELVPGAGHAVQSDQPLALTALIRDFTFPA
ncbi:MULTISPECIES: alpha/beta fold hydrolase [Pseudofrankia]|uniref:alpha/beta fold hydrolase n=1 Tax=Pseudofrankia TaxID=2994363 RepID=UPI000234BFF1|nr:MULTISPECIES: alpha/beta hydrolase [Pseudofrankia]OHV35246.1 hydrolase [Pseudofrankia sp. EUN1h]